MKRTPKSTGNPRDVSAPLVPHAGRARSAALRFLGLALTATDERAYAVINRWIERDDQRFQRYYDRFVEPFEPTVRQRVLVSPERLDRIRRWREHPLYGIVPYEAIFEGGDPEDVDDDAPRITYRLTIVQIARRFGLSDRDTEKLVPILQRQWHPDWAAEDSVAIVAALTGCSPTAVAARAALRNLLRRSPDRGRGRPRERSAAERFAAIRADVRRDAPSVYAQVRSAWRRRQGHIDNEDVVAILRSRKVTLSKPLDNAINGLLKRKRHQLGPRVVTVFVLTQMYRPRVSTLREADVSRLLSR